MDKRIVDKSERNNQVYIKCVIMFTVVLLVFFYLNYALFIRQANALTFVSEDGENHYQSDIYAYICEVMGIDTVYEFPYPVFFMLGKGLAYFVSPEIAVVTTAAVLNALSAIFLFVFFISYLRSRNSQGMELSIAAFLPFVLLMVSMIWISAEKDSLGVGQRYLGVFSPNPWHNHTYIAARPFVIITYLLFVKIIEEYEERLSIRNCLLFSLSLLIATMTKPSFTLIFGSTTLIFLIIRLVKGKFKTLKNSILLGICFIPTIIDLCYQFAGMFGSRGDAGKDGGVGFGVAYIWSLYTNNILRSVILAIFFPLIMLVFNYNKLKSSVRYRFAAEMMLVSFLEFLLLYEKGFRSWHANFAWGYMYGIFFFFLESIVVLIDNFLEKKKSLATVIGASALLLHLIMGIYYYIYLLRGGNYMVF